VIYRDGRTPSLAPAFDTWPKTGTHLRDEWPALYDRIDELLTTVPFFSQRPASRLALTDAKHEEVA
jgi:hypothetical protein